MAIPKLYSFCKSEMLKNASHYTDSGNCFEFTKMAENFIFADNISENEEESVFDGVVDWFNQWSGRHNFND